MHFPRNNIVTRYVEVNLFRCIATGSKQHGFDWRLVVASRHIECFKRAYDGGPRRKGIPLMKIVSQAGTYLK